MTSRRVVATELPQLMPLPGDSHNVRHTLNVHTASTLCSGFPESPESVCSAQLVLQGCGELSPAVSLEPAACCVSGAEYLMALATHNVPGVTLFTIQSLLPSPCPGPCDSVQQQQQQVGRSEGVAHILSAFTIRVRCITHCRRSTCRSSQQL